MLHSFLLAGLFCATAWAGYDDVLAIHRIETETADRIQAKIVDPILGPGNASVFVKLEVEVKRERETASREGMGMASRVKGKESRRTGLAPAVSTGTKTSAIADDDLFRGFGFDESDCGTSAATYSKQNGGACLGFACSPPSCEVKKSTDAVGQGLNVPRVTCDETSLSRESRQTKGIAEERYSARPVFKRFEVVIIHEKNAPSGVLKTVRDALVDAYSPELTPGNVAFRPVEFWKPEPKKRWLSWVERR